jgi:hypothetical protein
MWQASRAAIVSDESHTLARAPDLHLSSCLVKLFVLWVVELWFLIDLQWRIGYGPSGNLVGFGAPVPSMFCFCERERVECV